MDGSATATSRFGLLAVALGFLSLAGVLGHFVAGPFDPPPPVETSIAEKAVEIRDATVAALKGEEYEAAERSRPRTLDDYLTYGLMAAAALAILMAVVGFIRQESLRTSIAGAGLGGLAIALQVAIMMFVALICALLLAAVLDKLDFTA